MSRQEPTTLVCETLGDWEIAVQDAGMESHKKASLSTSVGSLSQPASFSPQGLHTLPSHGYWGFRKITGLPIPRGP